MSDPIVPVPGTDPEWEKIQAETPGLELPVKNDEEPTKVDNPPAQEVKPTEDITKETKSSDSGVDDDEDKQSKENSEDDEDDKTPSNDNPPAKKPRPERYIPVDKYNEKIGDFKKIVEDNQKRISELEKIIRDNQSVSKTDAAVKKYAEKYGLDIDLAREQIESLKEVLGVDIKPEDSRQNDQKEPELPEDVKARLENAEIVEAKLAFDNEFKSQAIPQIKSIFPNATPEQIEVAKEEIEKIACTNENLDKSLDFIVFNSKNKLSKFFAVKPGHVESNNRGADRNPITVTAETLRDGKTSFSELEKLSGDEQGRIIEQMDNETYEKYKRHLYSSDQLIINRGGKRVKF